MLHVFKLLLSYNANVMFLYIVASVLMVSAMLTTCQCIVAIAIIFGYNYNYKYITSTLLNFFSAQLFLFKSISYSMVSENSYITVIVVVC